MLSFLSMFPVKKLKSGPDKTPFLVELAIAWKGGVWGTCIFACFYRKNMDVCGGIFQLSGKAHYLSTLATISTFSYKEI